MMSERPSRGTRFASFSLTVVILCLGLSVSALGAYSLARRVQADAQRKSVV